MSAEATLPDTKHEKVYYLIVQLLRIYTCCLFAGRSWQYLRWHTPWEDLLSPVWAVYTQTFLGIILVIGALCAILGGIKIPLSVAKYLLYTGAAILLVQTILSSWKQNWNFAQFIEHTIQWSLPLFLAWALSNRKVYPTYFRAMKWAIALTFIGHGMFALGVYGDIPSHFLEMTQNIMGISQQAATNFLFVAGMLDMIVAIGIFFKKSVRWVLPYAIIWGTLTALARIVAYIDWEAFGPTTDRWLFETIYRLGHGGVPLILLISLTYTTPSFIRNLSLPHKSVT